MDFSVGAVGAALIGAIVTLLGLIISKENKTSEFRQAWIDSLRSELRDFLVSFNSVADASHAAYESKNEKIQRNAEVYSRLNAALFSISLRLNSEEADAKDLIDAANDMLSLARTPEPIEPSAIRPIEARFQSASKRLLKSEWNRVKRGEPFFAMVKWLSLLVSVVCLIGLAGLSIIGESDVELVGPTDQRQPLELAPVPVPTPAAASTDDP